MNSYREFSTKARDLLSHLIDLEIVVEGSLVESTSSVKRLSLAVEVRNLIYYNREIEENFQNLGSGSRTTSVFKWQEIYFWTERIDLKNVKINLRRTKPRWLDQ
jgi:hypothetical protein